MSHIARGTYDMKLNQLSLKILFSFNTKLGLRKHLKKIWDKNKIAMKKTISY